jgi:hypothetical protein
MEKRDYVIKGIIKGLHIISPEFSVNANCSFRHSGLDPESSFFQVITLLDAGSGLPSTRLGVRHDDQKLNAF